MYLCSTIPPSSPLAQSSMEHLGQIHNSIKKNLHWIIKLVLFINLFLLKPDKTGEKSVMKGMVLATTRSTVCSPIETAVVSGH